MFASQIADYQDDARHGSDAPRQRATTSTTALPLYEHIADARRPARRPTRRSPTARRSSATPTTAPASTPSAASTATRRSSTSSPRTTRRPRKTATFETYSAGAKLRAAARRRRRELRADNGGRVTVTLPPLSAPSTGRTRRWPRRRARPTVYPISPGAGGVVGGRAESAPPCRRHLRRGQLRLARPVGTTSGRARHRRQRAPASSTTSAAWRRARWSSTARCRRIRRHASRPRRPTASSASRRPPAAAVAAASSPITQPDARQRARQPQLRDGLPGRLAARTAPRPSSRSTPRTASGRAPSTLPAGDYEYKVAINKLGRELRRRRRPNGGNIAYNPRRRPGHVLLDHRTHWVTSDARARSSRCPAASRASSAAPATGRPTACARWLQDPDGDGIYTFSTDDHPRRHLRGQGRRTASAGTRTTGAGDVALSVPSDGVVTTITYKVVDARGHASKTSTGRRRARPDQGQGVRAGSATSSRGRHRPCRRAPTRRRLRWRLHWSADGGLAVDAEARSPAARVDADPRPRRACPPRSSAAHPALEGVVALRARQDRRPSSCRELLKGQLAVAQYDPRAGSLDATGVQIAERARRPVRRRARPRDLGVSFSGRQGRLPPLGADRAVGDAADLAGRRHRRPEPLRGDRRADDARPTDRGRRRSRRQGRRSTSRRSKVYAPTTGKVETNSVTDPYSVALTLNSTRSVAVDLRDTATCRRRGRRRRRRRSTSPSTRRSTSCTSATSRSSDATVPAAERGTYLAFTDDGAGTPQLEAARRGRAQHGAPAADVRHRHDRGGPGQAATPAVRPRVVRPGQRRAAGVRRRRREQRRLQLGLRPVPLQRARGLVRLERHAADGGARVAEFRTMVGALHQDGLQVVLDQVFNHTAAVRPGRASRCSTRSCPATTSASTRRARVETSTCCQNVATEHADGREAHGRLGRHVGPGLQGRRLPLRPDGPPLQGQHARGARGPRRAHPARRTASTARPIYLYGEGWNFGEVANNALFEQATQGQLGGTGIGTFNDRLRDARARRRPVRRGPAQAGLRHRRGHRRQRRDRQGRQAGQRRRGRSARARHRPRAARPRRQPARPSASAASRAARS